MEHAISQSPGCGNCKAVQQVNELRERHFQANMRSFLDQSENNQVLLGFQIVSESHQVKCNGPTNVTWTTIAHCKYRLLVYSLFNCLLDSVQVNVSMCVAAAYLGSFLPFDEVHPRSCLNNAADLAWL